MRRFIGLAALVFLGFLAWRVGGALSRDAIGMGVGLIFGVLAGIPAALLVLASDRRRRGYDDDDAWAYHRPAPYAPDANVIMASNGTFTIDAPGRPHPSQTTTALARTPAPLDAWQLGQQFGQEEYDEEQAIADFLDGYRLATGKEPNAYIRQQARAILYDHFGREPTAKAR